MQVKLSRTVTALSALLVFSLAASAQTTSLAGEVKGEEGEPLKEAWIKIDRKDIKGNYTVKSDKAVAMTVSESPAYLWLRLKD